MCLYEVSTHEVSKIRVAMIHTTNGMESVSCKCYNVARQAARIQRKKNKVQYIFFLEALAHVGHDALQFAHAGATAGATSPVSALFTICSLFLRVTRARNLFLQWKKHNNNLKKIYQNFYVRDHNRQWIQRPMCDQCSHITVEETGEFENRLTSVVAVAGEVASEHAVLSMTALVGDYFESILTGIADSLM